MNAIETIKKELEDTLVRQGQLVEDCALETYALCKAQIDKIPDALNNGDLEAVVELLRRIRKNVDRCVSNADCNLERRYATRCALELVEKARKRRQENEHSLQG